MPNWRKGIQGPQRKYVPKGKRKAAVKRKGKRQNFPGGRTYPFMRTTDELLALENPSASGASDWIQTVDDSVVKTFVFALNELPSHGEFTNLFGEYKLNMAILKMFPSYSSIVSTDAAVVSNNILITVWPNRTGTALSSAFTREDLDQIQRKRTWLLPINRPTTIKMPLNQLDARYGGGANVTDYMVARPKYCSTTETSTPHYGFNVHITKVDKSAFTSNSVRLLCKEKIYLTCRQVK